MSRRRVLLVGFLLLQVAALVCAGEIDGAADQADKKGTVVRDALTAESMTFVKAKVGVANTPAAAADPTAAPSTAYPTKPEEINVLPELPGSELLGVGLNLREGIGLEAMTRPLIRAREYFPFAMDNDLFYRIPTQQVARRNFKADMVTKVFNSNQERLFDLAVSAGISFEMAMFSGSAEAHVQITKQTNRKTVISQASLEVGLVDLGIVRYTIDDLDPALIADFKQLPELWTEGPMQLQDFVAKWGTHFVKSAEIGGAFDMVGTTTTATDVDNLSIAASVKISLEMAIKISAQASVDYKQKNVNEQFQNNFDFHARGGDPAVGAMLASAHDAGGKDGKMTDACSLWLASLKKTPTVKSMKLGYIYELFGGIAGNSTTRRQLALKQAIDVFLREMQVGTNVINLRDGAAPKFSNFWRVNDQCLNFQAVVGPQAKMQIFLTSSAYRYDLGYTIEIDMHQATILKGGQVVAKTNSIAAITPGSDTLYSSYSICYDSRAGTVLYARGRRVVLAYVDQRPESVYYYGFAGKGQSISSITALQLFSVYDLECPVTFGKPCGGPERGTCIENTRMCQCQSQARGFGCQLDCPIGINGTGCSLAGRCVIDEAQGDNAKAMCMCDSGSLGQACEISELPKLTLDVRPLGPGGQLLSGRPITFSLKRESSDGRAAAIEPTSTQFTIEEADADTVVVKNHVAFRTLSPGLVTVTGSITLPNNPDIVRVSQNFVVIDCTCSNKGRCDASGTCMCRAGASGTNCEDDVVTGVVNVPASRMNTRTITQVFTRRFSSMPKSVDVTVYEVPDTQQFNISVVSFTDREVTFVVFRTDSLDGWDVPLRMLYRAVGARYVGDVNGKVRFPAAEGQVARSVAVRFPMPYREKPFIMVQGVDAAKMPSGMQFRVLRSSTHGAVLETWRDEGTWNEPIDAEWTARPIGARDGYQHGEFKVGARKEGPARVYIAFPDVFREVPTVELRPKSSIQTELFAASVIELTQGGIVAEVALISSDKADAGWQQNLVLRWKAYPKGFDKSIVENAQSAEYLDGRGILGHDIGNPIQLPHTADEKDCAMACAQEPTCKGFTFHKRAPEISKEWTGGNGDLAPAIMAIDFARRVIVKPVENGGYVWLPTWSGNAWGAVTRLLMMRDGRLLGVTHDNRMVVRRTLRDEWEVVPNGCCIIAVTELQDGRLAAVGVDHKLWVTRTSALTSGFQIKTGNDKSVDTRARSADEMEQIVAAREKEAFVEVEGEVQSESESETDAFKPKKAAKSKAAAPAEKSLSPDSGKSAIAVAAAAAKMARRPPPPTKRPRVSQANMERVNDFLDITQLVDGTIVAASTYHYLFTLKDPNGDWRDWHQVGAHSCCVRTIAAHPKGGVIGVGLDWWLWKKENSLADDWQQIPGSCCVLDGVATFPKMSTGALSDQPGRCYLKSIRPTRSLLPHSYFVSGYFVKRDEDGNIVNQPKTIDYDVRAVGWGDGCDYQHYRSAHVIIGGKVQPLNRGINVYLIGKDGSVDFAQSDTFAHADWVQRGGGDRNVEHFLDVAMDAKQVEERGLVGIIMTCHDECLNQMPDSMKNRIYKVGLPGFSQATYRPSMLFIKDLRSGKIHTGFTGVGNTCSNVIRWGSFRVDQPDDE